MNKVGLYKTLTVLSIVIAIAIIFLKVSPFTCCPCPPVGYGFGFISWAFILNKYIAPVVGCDCAPFCTLTKYVIPIEPIVAAIIFGLLWIIKRKKAT